MPCLEYKNVSYFYKVEEETTIFPRIQLGYCQGNA